ncbi:mavicyanin [Cinnamomum micranthum f. kanehirae]|uniref:Mavicyanin n=1 Tax=Cinnamomum micranthum f. kanehirae TaxID=337451 RepID=A0A3S3N813_9MAGN|nr:mavicyanin [Cinnamomum micranthum f. kanehirae]
MDCVFGRVVMVAIFVALGPTREAFAAKHEVGGSQGWDVTANLGSWASSQTFRVGDQLDFKYTPGLHSVVELAGEKEYKNCDMSNTLNSMNGGTSMVRLDKPGYRYFTCGTLGHCAEGMKLKVKTLPANESSSPTSVSTSFASAASGFASFFMVIMSMSFMFIGMI